MPQVYDPNTSSWTQSPGSNAPAPAGTQSGPGGAFLRAPNKKTTVRGQLEGLLRDGGGYMQNARKTGEAFVARRGLLNSSLGAQASQSAAIAGAAPIAQADAQLQAQADAQNVEMLNATNIANIARQTASATGGGGGNGGGSALLSETEHARRMELMRLQSELNITEAEAGRIWEAEQGAIDRSWRSGESAAERDARIAEAERQRGFQGSQNDQDRNLTREEWNARYANEDRDRGWRSSEADRDRGFARETMTSEARLGMFRDVMSQSMSTIFSSPDFFRNPEASAGFMEFFSTQFATLFDRFFSPGGG